ncbi:MAG: prepilin-type N-terminal cleavage/methylation domain-containing protein [Ruminococcus sp.]|nr:prepilin-type N-terminal cleavage/methylation domain-containing protein [Ruminococcus sp.]
MLKKKGFTLIEMIVVLAIIGILAALLIPSVLGYVRKARRAADIAAAREIHNNVHQIITENRSIEWKSSSRGGASVYTHALESFYSIQGSSYKSIAGGGNAYYNKTDSDGNPYILIPVAVLDTNGSGKWMEIDQEQQPFVYQLNAQMENSKGKVDVPAKYEPKHSEDRLNRWFLCYRLDEPSEVEVWIGCKSGKKQNYSGKGKPMYRVYPEPTY